MKNPIERCPSICEMKEVDFPVPLSFWCLLAEGHRGSHFCVAQIEWEYLPLSGDSRTLKGTAKLWWHNGQVWFGDGINKKFKRAEQSVSPDFFAGEVPMP